MSLAKEKTTIKDAEPNGLGIGVTEENPTLMGTAMTTAVGTAVSTAGDYSQYAGAGLENIEKDEMLVPFLSILQPLSPAVDKTSPAYVVGAEPGMILNRATNQLIPGDPGMTFIPCLRTHTFPEFIPRDSGGGFQGVWAPDDPRLSELQKVQGKFGKLKLANGNELTETRSLYGIVSFSGETFPVIIGFSSTQIKKYTMIVSRLDHAAGNPRRFPMFAFQLAIGTQQEQNKKGKFWGWKIGFAGGSPEASLVPAKSDLFAQALSFHELLKSGAAKADYATTDAARGEAPIDDGEAPF